MKCGSFPGQQEALARRVAVRRPGVPRPPLRRVAPPIVLAALIGLLAGALRLCVGTAPPDGKLTARSSSG
jgi:hypothetical protein